MKYIVIGAEWCKECKNVDKVIKELNMSTHIPKYDIDNDEEEISKYISIENINKLPSMLLLDNDNNVQEILIGSTTIISEIRNFKNTFINKIFESINDF